MDDERIEELLRRAWNEEPPEGMRERVLRRSRQELDRQKKRRWRPAWRYALASLAVLVILASHAADFARQSRLTAMLGTPDEATVRTLIAEELMHRREMRRFLAGDYARSLIQPEQGEDTL